jgi:hypothetical protein
MMAQQIRVHGVEVPAGAVSSTPLPDWVEAGEASIEGSA